MKLDKEIISQLEKVFASLSKPVSLVIAGIKGDPKTVDMVEFANDFASASSQLSVVEENVHTPEGAPVLTIVVDGTPTGVFFNGIPGGHEFTSLILAVLNAVGEGKNLPDETLVNRIKALNGPCRTTSFVSLSCTNCPEVVQSLNIIALLNPNFSNMVVDGAVRPEEVKQYNVQSVPTVYADDQLLSVGRADLHELVEKLEQMYGTTREPDATDGQPKDYDVVVVGGGPAGAAAAIYLARKGLKTAVVAGRIGGQVKDTMDIENLISVPTTTGPALANDLRAHMQNYDIDIFDNRRITEVELKDFPKQLKTDSGEVFRAPQVIIATGASWRKLNIPGEAEYIGRGVAFCTHCDGPFYAGKRVAVIGGGNSGIEAAIDLAGIATHVDVFEFLDELKADSVLQEKLRTLPNVDVHLGAAVTEVDGNGKNVTGIKVRDRKTDVVTDYADDGVFVQIGLTPNSAPFSEQLKTNRAGEIEIDRNGRTSLTGVYAAGDVADVPFKQIVISMGSGATAALSAVDDRMRGVTPA